MSKISQRRALLLAALVPALLVAGCSAGNNTQAMKGAASPATPTDMDSGMSPEETDMSTGTASPTDTATQGGAGGQAKAVVQGYFTALKSGNADQLVSSFTDNAVVALDGEPTAEGSQAIRTLFQGQMQGSNDMGQATHTIEEARTAGSEDAVVSSTSKQGDDNYRELFVLSRDGGEWKISHFMNNQAG
ncbi:nuclear transport factor 2 family protein [Nonomuraea sp. NPDC050643]|uniref:YybH family protein n=1 Tax=Nonomuraea sp. NPDC050643 TaxID=3155660 RepID=UPI0034022063